MFGERQSMGFMICAFHANHVAAKEARMCDLRSVIVDTMDEWTVWNEKQRAELEEYCAQFDSVGG
jgi:hypothetical protein